MRLLIIEDDPLLLRSLSRILMAAGYDIAGTPGSVAAALATIAAGSFDAAILDANLRRQSAAPIAAALKERAVPFVVVTGYNHRQLAETFSGAPCLSKPFEVDQLLTLMQQLKGA